MSLARLISNFTAYNTATKRDDAKAEAREAKRLAKQEARIIQEEMKEIRTRKGEEA